MIPSRRPLLLVLSLLCVFILTSASGAQRGKKPLPDTVFTKKPELMKELGLSYGPFAFAHSNSDQVGQELLISRDVLWLQTPHFRIGSMMKKWKIPVPERKAYRAELAEMQATYPEIDPKVSTLDPWLRLHLYAWRMEKMYALFLDHMGLTDEDFLKLPPEEIFDQAFAGEYTDVINQFELDRGGQVRSPGFPEWVGMGQFLGEPYRFEIFMCEEESVWREFKLSYFGIKTTHPQRWNIKVESTDKGLTQSRSRCMLFGISGKQAEVRHEQHMHNALRHNMAINFLDGYMLYLFDLPSWLREGYAHYMRRLNLKGYSFYDTGEGGAAIDKDLEEWAPLVRKLVKKNEAADFATLARLNDYVDLDFDAHVVVWSKIEFLITTDKVKFGQFVTKLKSQESGAGMADAQRKAFKEIYGWTMRQADEAWKTWVLETYAVK
jgi:hypothetical protein